jgi:hypothetical protein
MTQASQPNNNQRPALMPAWLRHVPRPAYRSLRGYAFDPSLSMQLETLAINQAVFKVPWEQDLEPGPVGEYLEVVDHDPASDCFYTPVDLNNPTVLAQDGLAPSEGNPQFHQQMVYAVAMTTIRNFERALGRRALWRSLTPDEYGQAQAAEQARRVKDAAIDSAQMPNGAVPAPAIKQDDSAPQDPEEKYYVGRLRIYPHALRAANAYYSPQKRALLFGYFPASASNPGNQLPGGTVFTCLSHDIITHETTHALLDGIHRRFIEPTNPDSLAFHEAFADIVALFQHFTFPEVLRQQIAGTRGDLGQENLLGKLAEQFGQATGRYTALRDAIGKIDSQTGKWTPTKPDPEEYRTEFEPHRRGAILVAAVFDAFITIYKRRVTDLVRIATAGSGVLPDGALHPDLVNRLADEAAKSAQHVLNACIRAMDYVPPMDITFDEYLRALITADFDLVPDDEHEYRVAFIEAFRRRGIYPRNVRSFSVDSLRWPEVLDQSVFNIFEPIAQELLKEFASNAGYLKDRKRIYLETHGTSERLHKRIEKTFGKPNYLDDANLRRKVSEITGLAPRADTPGVTNEILEEFRAASGLDKYRNPRFEIHALSPVQRVGPQGNLLNQLIVVITQRRQRKLPDGQVYLFRGGCTFILDLSIPRVRYCITKPIIDAERLQRQEAYMRDQPSAALRATYFSRDDILKEPFALLHSAL